MAVYEINTLTIEKGATFDETFKIYNEDGSLLGINTSFTGSAKLRKYPTSPISYPFNLVLDDENDEVNISMASTVTAQLPFSGRCYFDVILTYGYTNPTTKKYVKGTIIVNDSTSL